MKFMLTRALLEKFDGKFPAFAEYLRQFKLGDMVEFEEGDRSGPPVSGSKTKVEVEVVPVCKHCGQPLT